MKKEPQKNNGFLTRESILNAAAKLRYKDVTIPEWGGKIRVKAMSSRDYVEYVEDWPENPELDEIYARLVVCCAYDENNNRLFTMEDKPILRESFYRPMTEIGKLAIDVNEMGKDVKK
jgi:hypothetical protein